MHSFKAASNCASISDEIFDCTIYRTNQRNNVGRLCGKFVGELFVVRDQMSNINVAVVLFYQDILSQLIPAADVLVSVLVLVP